MKEVGLTKKQISEFLDCLQGKEGCHFHYKGKHVSENFIWKCGREPERPIARRILEAMGVKQQSIEKFLAWCRKNGGCCDCEIIWNCAKKLDALTG